MNDKTYKQPYIVTERVNVVNARVPVCKPIENNYNRAILNNSSVLTHLPNGDMSSLAFLSVEEPGYNESDDRKYFMIETDDGRIDTFKGRHGVIQYLTAPKERSQKYFKVVTEVFPVINDEVKLSYYADNVDSQSPILNFGFAKLITNEGTVTPGTLFSLHLRNWRHTETAEFISHVELNLSQEDKEENFDTMFKNSTAMIQYTTLVDAGSEPECYLEVATEKHIADFDGSIQLDREPYVENDLIQPFLNFNRIIIHETGQDIECESELVLSESNPYEVFLGEQFANKRITIQYLTMTDASLGDDWGEEEDEEITEEYMGADYATS